MHTQGMWAGETKPPRKPIVSKDEVAFINADKAGIFIPSVEHNGIVKKGQELAVIADPLTGAARQTLMAPADGLLSRILTEMREETLYELETPYRQKFRIKGFRFGEGEKACAMVAAVRGNEVQQMYVCALLRYLSQVGLLRYNCHSGYLSSVVQENEMANVLTPAGGIFRRFVEPGQEVEYGQKLGGRP